MKMVLDKAIVRNQVKEISSNERTKVPVGHGQSITIKVRQVQLSVRLYLELSSYTSRDSSSYAENQTNSYEG